MDIEKSYEIGLPVEQVFAAWVSSDTVIPPATRMDIDPAVGSHFRLYVESPEFNATMEGAFSEVVENKRLVYTWEWNKDGEVTTVAVDFSPADNGRTRVDVKHTGFQKEESRAMHDSGWDSYTDGLKKFLGAGE